MQTTTEAQANTTIPVSPEVMNEICGTLILDGRYSQVVTIDDDGVRTVRLGDAVIVETEPHCRLCAWGDVVERFFAIMPALPAKVLFREMVFRYRSAKARVK